MMFLSTFLLQIFSKPYLSPERFLQNCLAVLAAVSIDGLLVEETKVSGEKHQVISGYWQFLPPGHR